MIKSEPTELLGILLFTLGRPVFNLFCFTTMHHLPPQVRDTWGSMEVYGCHKQSVCTCEDKRKPINLVGSLCLSVDKRRVKELIFS